MSFLRGLLAGRSHLAFLLGLGGAVAVAHGTSRLAWSAPATISPEALGVARGELPLRGPGRLSPAERALARAAWAYFEHNTERATGLARSVAGYPSTTMWEVGSQLMAILAAEDLGLASRAEGERRLRQALSSLAALPLCDGKLPNKAYDTRTLEMVDYGNRPAPDGIGWSALDLGRLFVPLAVVTRRHPDLTPLVERAVGRWDLQALSDGSSLRGATRRRDGTLDTYQEGRLGYEQYAAKALLPWGVPLAAAVDYGAHAAVAEVSGQRVAFDDRQPRDHGGTHNAVLSDPWVLEGIEQGFGAEEATIARAVLLAQERRFRATARLTAVGEDALDRPPGFAYSAVLNGGVAWTAFWPDGTPAPQDLTFSTKAAVGWAALFGGDYGARLVAAAASLVVPGAGVYAGRYDATGEPNRVLSVGTNAVVLEALAYRVRGPFLRRTGMPLAAEVRR